MAILGRGVIGAPLSEGALFVGNNLDQAVEVPIGTAGNVLTSDGTNISWQPPSGGGISGIDIEFDGAFAANADTINFLNPAGSTSITSATSVDIDLQSGAPLYEGYILFDSFGTLPNARQLAGTDGMIVLNDQGSGGELEISIAPNPVIPGVAAMTVPIGETSDRPAPSTGLLRFNATTGELEFSDGAGWFDASAANLTDGSGTTVNGSAIDLGGQLNQNAIINTSFHDFIVEGAVFQGYPTIRFTSEDSDGGSFSKNEILLGAVGIIVETNGSGIQYAVDYSIGYSDRSLTDKAYVDGPSTFVSVSTDPSDPAQGESVMWMSDGTGTGDAGDILMKINVGGTVKTTTMVDYSAV